MPIIPHGVKAKKCIAVFGFESIGFREYDFQNTRFDDIEFCRVDFSERDVHLDIFDGVIFPAGIFEKISIVKTIQGSHEKYEYYQADLLAREKQILSLLKKRNAWVAVLVHQPIRMTVNRLDVSMGDLSKRILKSLNVVPNSIAAFPHVKHRRNEFEAFIQKYGTAHSDFKFDPKTIINLAGDANRTLGFCNLNADTFFLPFHTNDLSPKNLSIISRMVTNAIHTYKQNMDATTPDWVNEFKFQKEASLEKDIKRLEIEIAKLTQQVDLIKNYKAILSATGDFLVTMVEKVLSEFFDLEIGNIDEFEEDLSIKSEGKMVALIEVKGIKGHINRSQITKTEEHRNAKGLAREFPAILVINDRMDLNEIRAKEESLVASDIASYAAVQHIKVFRTTTLLNYMKAVESLNIEERRKIIFDFLTSSVGGLVELKDDKLSVREKQYGIAGFSDCAYFRQGLATVYPDSLIDPPNFGRLR